jgi:hypothetical protein
MGEDNNIESLGLEEGKGYYIKYNQINIPGCKDPKDRHPMEETLYKKVGNIVAKEMLGRGPELFDERHFPAHTLDTRLFDFIRVIDIDEEIPDRLFVMLYAHRYTHYYHHHRGDFPSSWYQYPMGSYTEGDMYDDFRKDLEKGEIPTPAWYQTAVRIGSGGGNFCNIFYPCCVEVTKQEDIEEIEALVQQAVDVGVRQDIINGTPKGMKDILARVANDDSLPLFDYRDDFGLPTC